MSKEKKPRFLIAAAAYIVRNLIDDIYLLSPLSIFALRILKKMFIEVYLKVLCDQHVVH